MKSYREYCEEEAPRRDSAGELNRLASRRDMKAKPPAELSRSNSVASAASEAPSMDASAAASTVFQLSKDFFF